MKNNVKLSYWEGQLGRVYQQEERYIADNPDEVVFHITDHIGKIIGEGADKTRIDEHANNMSKYREIMGWTPLDVSQFNRQGQTTDRRTKLNVDITETDFKGSGVPYENCDIALGIINPHKLGKTLFNKFKMKLRNT